MNNTPYPIFSVFGIELEYMIVDHSTLNVKPIADELLTKLAGELTDEVECGEISITNELVLHVIELKTNGPKPSLNHLGQAFHNQIQEINRLLNQYNACLMPSAAHPWLNPKKDTHLWPHGNRSIYETYHRIFNCEGHGWSNLQSAQINLPFANDKEFSQLHNAIRILLPIIPSLTASSPFLEGKLTNIVDNRLFYYGKNQQLIPIIAGEIIPEFVQTKEHYQQHLLKSIYEKIAPFDPEKILQYEWVNSRGAIARFDRSAIEIRVMDTQECPLADFACIAAVVGVLRYLIANTDQYLANPLDCKSLRILYENCVTNGMNAMLSNVHYFDQFQMTKVSMTANKLWEKLLEKASTHIDFEYQVLLEKLIASGNLAERLIKAIKSDVNMLSLKSVYSQLCECLKNNSLFML